MSARLRARRLAEEAKIAEEAAAREKEKAAEKALSESRADSPVSSAADDNGVFRDGNDVEVSDEIDDPNQIIQGMWQLPCIFFFLKSFRQFFNFYIKIEDIQAALIDAPDSIGLGQIHVTLLSNLLGRKDVLLNTWRDILKEEFMKRPELNERGFFSEVKVYDQLSVQERLQVLYAICQWHISENESLLEFCNTKVEPENIRVLPIGCDALGAKFWYFKDLRLYREVPPKRASKKGPGAKRSWSVVCSSADEWTAQCKRYSKSKNASEKALHEVLSNDIGPKVLAKLQTRKKEEEKRMMYDLMPKKRSSRLQVLDVRKQEEEKKAILKKEEEKLRAFEKSQLKKQRELEDKRKREEEERVSSAMKKEQEEKEKQERLERERERRALERKQRIEERERALEAAELERMRVEHQRKKRAEKRRRIAQGLPFDDLSSDDDSKKRKRKKTKNSRKEHSDVVSVENENEIEVVDMNEPASEDGEKYVFSTQLANAAAAAVYNGHSKSLVQFFLDYREKKNAMEKAKEEKSMRVKEISKSNELVADSAKGQLPFMAEQPSYTEVIPEQPTHNSYTQVYGGFHQHKAQPSVSGPGFAGANGGHPYPVGGEYQNPSGSVGSFDAYSSSYTPADGHSVGYGPSSVCGTARENSESKIEQQHVQESKIISNVSPKHSTVQETT
eukprot:Nk52_evm27s246 gene=Nk52_evmTU27s246